MKLYNPKQKPVQGAPLVLCVQGPNIYDDLTVRWHMIGEYRHDNWYAVKPSGVRVNIENDLLLDLVWWTYAPPLHGEVSDEEN